MSSFEQNLVDRIDLNLNLSLSSLNYGYFNSKSVDVQVRRKEDESICLNSQHRRLISKSSAEDALLRCNSYQNEDLNSKISSETLKCTRSFIDEIPTEQLKIHFNDSVLCAKNEFFNTNNKVNTAKKEDEDLIFMSNKINLLRQKDINLNHFENILQIKQLGDSKGTNRRWFQAYLENLNPYFTFSHVSEEFATIDLDKEMEDLLSRMQIENNSIKKTETTCPTKLCNPYNPYNFLSFSDLNMQPGKFSPACKSDVVPYDESAHKIFNHEDNEDDGKEKGIHSRLNRIKYHYQVQLNILHHSFEKTCEQMLTSFLQIRLKLQNYLTRTELFGSSILNDQKIFELFSVMIGVHENAKRKLLNSFLEECNHCISEQIRHRDFDHHEEEMNRKRFNLPKNAITLMRAWLFNNFLQPYPSETDKLNLAHKTGLTTTQVNNWFINARVRLWRPLVDDLTKEIEPEQELTETHNLNAGKGCSLNLYQKGDFHITSAVLNESRRRLRSDNLNTEPEHFYDADDSSSTSENLDVCFDFKRPSKRPANGKVAGSEKLDNETVFSTPDSVLVL